MKILNISVKDYAGVSIKLTQALQQNTEHEVRNISLKKHRLEYPTDIVTKDKDILRKWTDWADIVNCFSTPKALVKRPKNLIVTYIGTYYRKNPMAAHLRSKELGAKKELVAGLWMQDYGGFNFDWIPVTVPVDEWSKMKQEHKGKPIICQSPTRFKMENAWKIVSLLEKKRSIELMIIQGVNNNECLKLKSKADIYVGQFGKGYGVSALEAIAMGIPVITSMPNKEIRQIKAKVGYIPHYNSEFNNLPEAVDRLVDDKKLYETYAKRSREYIRNFHDYPVVAKRFIKVCEEVLSKK